jgi:putative ABC transport system permease protein
MSAFRLILTYSFRLVKREWRRFVLPLLSLSVTSIVLTLILILTGSSADLLENQARELQGGDVVFESNFPIPGQDIFNEVGINPEVASNKLSFSATLQSENNTAPFSVEVVDDKYPIYGELLLADAIFDGVSDGELYLDQSGMERLEVQVGDTVSFGESKLRVSGIVISKPTSLFGGFVFLPTAFMSAGSFESAAVDPQLLRVEYNYAAKVPNLTTEAIEALRAYEDINTDIDVDIAGQDQRGLQFGLSTVSDFLTVAVLITAVLAAVNVYASILYLVTIERKSLAIMLALGLTKRRLILVLGAALGYVVALASALGLILALVIFKNLQTYIFDSYLVDLPTPDILFYCLTSVAVVVVIAFMSFLPAVRKSLELNPKQILIGGEPETAKSKPYATVIFITVSTLLPLVVLAAFLLKSFLQGLLVIGIIATVYVLVALLYAFILKRVYLARGRMSFILRSIVSQKYVEGLFGVVSFASLFVALTALSTLALLQVSLERFLVNDLSGTVPSTYVLDVQPSQKDSLITNFPELQLFSNVGSRIISIDGLRIQDELEAGNPAVSRELGREFSLTARNELLDSEEVVAGVWSSGAKGEISVDEDFAKQANISLGSNITFLIQGFEVSGTVTSLRSTDSRSGLPFFYFVMSPEDIGMFPSVYFGFSYYEENKQDELGVFLAQNMPNVSVIETQTIGPLILKIVGTLMVLVLIVTLPPLFIATLLIAMLVVSSYATRRREGARFRAIGLSRRQVFWQYLFETISITLVASVFAYLLGMAAAAAISSAFLELDSVVLFDGELLLGLSLVVLFITSIALYLYKSDTVALRELLSYE